MSSNNPVPEGQFQKLHDSKQSTVTVMVRTRSYLQNPESSARSPLARYLRLAIAVGIVVATATALSAQPTYRLHNNGELWVSRAGTCDGKACVKWHLLDHNPTTREITAGGWTGAFDPLKAPPDAAPLYKRSDDGRIWRYTGKPCSGGLCSGWEPMDANQRTVSIVAAGRYLYKRHNDGAIYGTKCNPDGSCPEWRWLDNNPDTVEIAAGGIPEQNGFPERTELYKRHSTGGIWRYTGKECRSDGTCPGWELVDNSKTTAEITATVLKRSDGGRVQALYKRDVNGSIWRYKGTPCSSALSCPEWEQLDNSGTISIVTATDHLYQLRTDGSILVYIPGQPCSRESCPRWKLLDKNTQTRQIVAGTVELYKRHDNGAIWRYAGGTDWQLLYDPTTWTIGSTQN